MLKENISSIESTKNNQMFTSMSQFNEELEHKVTQLETKLRKVQEEKIDIEQELSKIKTNQTLEGYKSLQNEHNERNRVRELETQLAAERARNETERKALYEKNLLLEELKSRLMEYDNREKVIITQYEEKLRTFHSEFLMH
jgi:predicted  nucleic acid-binding Zn-ribbon protein